MVKSIGNKYRLLFLLIGIASTGFIIWIIANLNQHKPLLIAAGKKEGESYKISLALAQVLKNKYSLDVGVCITDGTEQNVTLLEQGKVQLATAQADYASEEIGKFHNLGEITEEQQDPRCGQILKNSQTQTIEIPKKLPQTVAILYKDYFQLFVQDKKGKVINSLNDFKGKNLNIDVPLRGGQRWSFDQIAKHYGLVEGQDYTYVEEKKYRVCPQETDVLFRVRALNNKEISTLIERNCGKLLPIDQAKAMKLEHLAFEDAKIPTGTYKSIGQNKIISTPSTQDGLDTVSIPRLLLASENVDENKIQIIARALFDNRREIVSNLDIASQYIKPLIANITRPDDSYSKAISIPIHKGALAYYNPENPILKYLNDNGNAFNLIVALLIAFVTFAPGLLGWLISLPGKRERTIKLRKQRELADRYIKEAIEFMSKDKGDIQARQEQLDKKFSEVAQALIIENISQESFRTFNEAYQTTRETIERERLLEQKNKADNYITAAIKLMSKEQGEVESRKKKLDEEFNQVAQALIKEIISQESFRTFNEAYKTTREAIERERQTTEQELEHKQREKSATYIKAVVELLQDNSQNKEELHQRLDSILKQVARDLAKENISQESFRTFVEAYKTTRDAIDRKSSL